jgi:hypothetical protein
MMKLRTPASCQCDMCQQHPFSAVARQHRKINRVVASFDERQRRLFVGFLADQIGMGGVSEIAMVTGMSRNTVRRGKMELAQPLQKGSRIRVEGGGRKPLEKK